MLSFYIFVVIYIIDSNVKNAVWILLFFFLQHAFGSEYVLNESALHSDTREFSLGGLICDYTTEKTTEMSLTCLIPFQLYELSVRKLDFSRNLFGLASKVEWYQSGNEDWMENNVSLHLGKQLCDHFFLGVNACLLLVDQGDEGLATALFTELDGHYRLNENLILGIRVVNPAGTQLKSADEYVPLSSSAHLGAAYSPTTKCLIFTEMDGRIHQPLRLRMGLEFDLYKSFTLRTGFSTMPLMPSWGIGGDIHHFQYSWGGNLHPILGFSNGITLTYRW